MSRLRPNPIGDEGGFVIVTVLVVLAVALTSVPPASPSRSPHAA